MELSPDQVVYWSRGWLQLNATLVFTWLSMFVMVAASWLVTRRIRPGASVSRAQAVMEMVVVQLREQIRDAAQEDPDAYLPFIGTLFLFIAVSTLLGVIPGVQLVAASLSTTGALAACVLLAVPWFGIRRLGLRRYLHGYVQPNVLMLPFHLIGELSRTLALAVRLFGNLMSSRVIVAILLSIVPFLFPVLMEAFGLLLGMIQAYVFAILALVYVASGARSRKGEPISSSGEKESTWKLSS